ncbi:hypothetical protein K5F27_17050 [Acinetobacter baumannii]|uniref:hypothetical protein n=1 Tax=Acinetobacter baumannii TaxID=470 RepID=UPI001FF63ACD|nr:hypothetical protein [Acinetobacter baumannii]MCJ9119022.1 hypothetical protein [Acinetobacter baumannii]MCJ9181383.1 hypothetical protein [Acinetobacter baumannii]MCJ9185052.1 hypothetical protein [Acinetobacter baumannii]MCJ9192365.1 hypothetical protein [Acinetobacter baumannii]MCJ9199696.1 hypothetical protein [Acinetobacter baumannii]
MSNQLKQALCLSVLLRKLAIIGRIPDMDRTLMNRAKHHELFKQARAKAQVA